MPIYAQFECIIKELNKKHKCIFKENIVLFLWKFWHDGSECHHRIKKHTDSKNIKSKFHCICNAISSHCWYLLQVYSSHKPNWCMFFFKTPALLYNTVTHNNMSWKLYHLFMLITLFRISYHLQVKYLLCDQELF